MENFGKSKLMENKFMEEDSLMLKEVKFVDKVIQNGMNYLYLYL